MFVPNSYLLYHQNLITQLAAQIRAAPFNQQEPNTRYDELLEKLDRLSAMDDTHGDIHEVGQWVLIKIVSNFQNLMPSVPRNLFWFFGGDCLHFLGDEEIAFFQRVDEVYHEHIKNNKDEALTYEQILLSEEGEGSALH